MVCWLVLISACICRMPSWTPKIQPSDSSAVVWLSFWCSTRLTWKKCLSQRRETYRLHSYIWNSATRTGLSGVKIKVTSNNYLLLEKKSYIFRIFPGFYAKIGHFRRKFLPIFPKKRVWTPVQRGEPVRATLFHLWLRSFWTAREPWTSRFIPPDGTLTGESRWTSKTQPNDSRAAVWARFWYSTRSSAVGGDYLYKSHHYRCAAC